MKNVILTGHTSGIGKELSSQLQNTYNVIKIHSRLENFDELELEIKEILKKSEINILINCAGFGIFEPLEEINTKDIKKLIYVNLLAPILITSLTLRSLKKTQGQIINISSIEALKSSKFSAIYTASKAGLRAFSLSLFEEVRKSGVRISNINPDITNTSFFDNLHFKPSEDELCFLNPKNISEQIINIINFKGVITDITIRPQKFQIQKNINLT